MVAVPIESDVTDEAFKPKNLTLEAVAPWDDAVNGSVEGVKALL